MAELLYTSLARWYTLVTAPGDYEEEAAWYTARIREIRPGATTLLELGCGVGANASFMKKHFEMTLVDASVQMLSECRKLNSGLATHRADMRTFRCDERFDVVFVHDAASYMTTTDDVARLSETVAYHLNAQGVALICPDDFAEDFQPETESGGHDGDDGRGLRYLSWSVARGEHEVVTDYAYLLRSADGTVSVEHDQHITGRLPMKTWTDALEEVGLSCEILPLEHSEVAMGTHHLIRAALE
jgi:trans-aconitate methyltransferase